MLKLLYITAASLIANSTVAMEPPQMPSDAPGDILKRLTNTPTDEIESNEVQRAEATTAPLPAKQIDNGSRKTTEHKLIQLNKGSRMITSLTVCPGNVLKGTSLIRDKKIINNGRITINVSFLPGDYVPGDHTYLFSKAYEGELPTVPKISDKYAMEAELVSTEDGVSQLLLKLKISESFSVNEPKKPSSENAEEGDDSDWRDF